MTLGHCCQDFSIQRLYPKQSSRLLHDGVCGIAHYVQPKDQDTICCDKTLKTLVVRILVASNTQQVQCQL